MYILTEKMNLCSLRIFHRCQVGASCHTCCNCKKYVYIIIYVLLCHRLMLLYSYFYFMYCFVISSWPIIADSHCNNMPRNIHQAF